MSRQEDEEMEMAEKTMLKAAVVGIANTALFFLLQGSLRPVVAGAVAATISVLLFHWLPPRVHRKLSAPFSLGAALGAGALAAGLLFAVERIL